jgi:hypothetical protein
MILMQANPLQEKFQEFSVFLNLFHRASPPKTVYGLLMYVYMYEI